MEVHKFGGWDVGTETNARKSMSWAKDAVERAHRNKKRVPVVVVSALSGVTKQLIAAAKCARDTDHKRAGVYLDSLAMRHFDMARLLSVPRDTTREIEAEFLERKFLSPNGNFLRFKDHMMAAGEIASGKLFAAALSRAGIPALWIDPRLVMITDDNYGSAIPDIATITERARELILRVIEQSIVPVIGGFVGCTADGVTTTVGLEGSDLTATILASCLDAELVVIYKDVDGVFDEDPKKNPNARFFSRLTYTDGERLAKHLHPRTIEPLVAKKIPLKLRNLNKPEHPGTLIAA